MENSKEWFFFALFILVVLFVNSCRVKIERTTVVTDDIKKVVLDGHEYWVSGTNITHSVSCPCNEAAAPATNKFNVADIRKDER